MSFKAIQSLITNTQAYTSNTASQLVLPAAVITMLTAQLAGGHYTAVSVSDGVNYEVMNITGVTSGAANVQRGQDGTTAVPLARGAAVRFVWTTVGIQDTAPAGAVTCTGAGATGVSGGPNYTISSQFVQVLAGAGINVTGVYPNFTVENTSVFSPITVSGSGIAVATGGPANYNVDVPTPVFNNGTGINVTGTYPNFTIACTITGNAGTVTSVAGGAGITISGTPSINPTVSLSTTGPGAGVYGGITINNYGQITAFAASLITSITSSTLTLTGPSGGILGINVATAAVGTRGIVALAPATSGGSNDPLNGTEAVTPAGLNAVVAAAALTFTPASFAVSGNQSALSAGSYTNTIGSFTIPITVLTGKSALIDLYVETSDPSNPTVVQSCGIALFDGSTLLAGTANIVGSQKHLKYLINGPYSSTLTVKTTTLVGTQVVGSYYASVTKN